MNHLAELFGEDSQAAPLNGWAYGFPRYKEIPYTSLVWLQRLSKRSALRSFGEVFGQAVTYIHFTQTEGIMKSWEWESPFSPLTIYLFWII